MQTINSDDILATWQFHFKRNLCRLCLPRSGKLYACCRDLIRHLNLEDVVLRDASRSPPFSRKPAGDSPSFRATRNSRIWSGRSFLPAHGLIFLKPGHTLRSTVRKQQMHGSLEFSKLLTCLLPSPTSEGFAPSSSALHAPSPLNRSCFSTTLTRLLFACYASSTEAAIYQLFSSTTRSDVHATDSVLPILRDKVFRDFTVLRHN